MFNADVPGPTRDMDSVVSAQWLMQNLHKVRVVDASWYMPADKRDPQAEFEAAHIPGSVFYDIDKLSDRNSPLPHMLPTPETFSREASVLGIGDDDRVVVYDSMGMFSAPRVWFALRAMGHDEVAVLDGGLPAWKAAGGHLEYGPARLNPAIFTARLNEAVVRDFEAVKMRLRKTQILD